MTIQADQIRDRRRAFAAPGSTHDRIVRAAGVLLPSIVGATLAVMVILPAFPKNEVSFLLDRNRVAVTEDRLTVSRADYRGVDDQGRGFSVDAGNAVQHTASVPVVELNDLNAHMQLSDGSVLATAPRGSFHTDTDQLVASGPVSLSTTTGSRIESSAITVDLRHRRAFGEGGVSGRLTTGPFRADSMTADLAARTVTLDGHARMTILPGARISHP